MLKRNRPAAAWLVNYDQLTISLCLPLLRLPSVSQISYTSTHSDLFSYI
ncbi:hypothetical protein HMPREF1872_01374 [Amygdalobacter nucleatus]|uniref:Uncharacterized protein n=1 Tax=Amygdalobacter nucleatus TaxID=3029274 RepID=A0A133Y762_9FIRM|nr:hypothetical protein HMPREF1872_01374 [Amygdalobacter nucleatus]